MRSSRSNGSGTRDRRQESHPTRDPAEQNIQAVAGLEESARFTRSAAECVSDSITTWAGSQWSLALHAVWFGTWVAINSGWLRLQPFDPFPFSLLTSVVSLEAIFLTLFVLASQNRLTREADKRAHLDLQVNLLSEQEMTLVLRMLHELCDRFELTGTTHSQDFKALVKRTNVRNLAQRVEQTLSPESTPEGTTATPRTRQGVSAS